MKLDIQYSGEHVIAGIDEVGRGPLCGPVVSCAVVLPKNISIGGINDSKKLSKKNRDLLFEEINEKAQAIGIGLSHERTVDEVNVLESTLLSMKEALLNLKTKPTLLLVDGNMRQLSNIKQINVVKGDSKSQSIAAASIVAKVTRDRMMCEYAKVFPGYGFETNMGYGTKSHLSALKNIYATPIHRKTFRPVSDYLPKFSEIKNIRLLSVQIAASELIKSNHKVISIDFLNKKSYDFITLKDQKFNVFVFSKLIDLDKNKIIEQSNKTIYDKYDKKDMRLSIIICLTSVKFSSARSKVTYKYI